MGAAQHIAKSSQSCVDDGKLNVNFPHERLPLTRVKIEHTFTEATALISGLSMCPCPHSQPPAEKQASLEITFRESEHRKR